MQLLRTDRGVRIFANVGLDVDFEIKNVQEGVEEYAFSLRWNKAEVNEKDGSFKLEWEIPALDVFYLWHPNIGTNRIFYGLWRLGYENMMTVSAPVSAMFGAADDNFWTIATDEVMHVSKVLMGGCDDESTVIARVEMGLRQFAGKSSHRFTVRLDRRRIPLYRALSDVRAWWEGRIGAEALLPPKVARMPMYSSWYAWHQKITAELIERECAQAAKLGMQAVIVDDGWQTENSGGAYGYTGDWQVAPGKIADMRAHVENVHKMGLKYILWYSVPFIGYYSKIWERFGDKTLYDIPRLNCAVLDPRYREVREYLIETYAGAVRNWDLDGFKLDFIDSFVQHKDAPYKPGMDFEDVQEATQRLMLDIVASLKALKEDILIEFRQSYVGPMMRAFGNMFRVGDCGGDIASNRIGIMDLRMFSGSTACHGDMLAWNHAEKVEDAALQLLNCLFGVVQFSQIISDMPEEHVRMSRFWLDFMIQNEKILQESELIAPEPQNLYPVVVAQDDNEAIVGVYARGKVIDLPVRNRVQLVNASTDSALVVRSAESFAAKITVQNTLGEIVREGEIQIGKGLNEIPVPRSSLIVLEKI